MSKIKKEMLQKDHNKLVNQFAELVRNLKSLGLIADEVCPTFTKRNLMNGEPQLKQLDQSVFNGLDEKWKFAAVDGCTSRAYVYEQKPHIMHIKRQYWRIDDGLQHIVGDSYDASNWQNSLIERDIAKELTGSDLARAMLARGDRWILCGNTTDGFASPCIIDGYRCSEYDLGFVLTNGKSIEPQYIHPVNNQGEPSTQAEAGL